MVLSPVSPYLTIVNQEIYRLQQMGFVQKWLAEYLPTKDRCWSGGKMVEIENHTVNLNDMQGCFLVLLAGMRDDDVVTDWRIDYVFLLWFFV